MEIFEMTQDVKLLGTDLELHERELVIAVPATNLPQGGYFVSPAYHTFDNDDTEASIHCDGTEFMHFSEDSTWTPPGPVSMTYSQSIRFSYDPY